MLHIERSHSICAFASLLYRFVSCLVVIGWHPMDANYNPAGGPHSRQRFSVKQTKSQISGTNHKLGAVNRGERWLLGLDLSEKGRKMF